MRTNSEWSRTLAAQPFDNGVPTLELGKYRKPSRQIHERFELFGRWEWATHGHWLGTNDLQALWNESAEEDQFISRIRFQSLGIEANWTNSAPALFRPDRLSLFAASDVNYESVFLLWLDCEEEPEVWVYDSNGESRYKDLAHYLQAYLDDDVSAAQRHWKLSDIDNFGSRAI